MYNKNVTIGVDLDGVVFDFVTDLVNFTNARFGHQDNPEDVDHWDWWTCRKMDITKTEFIQGMEEYTRLRMWRNMPIYPDVKSNLCSLSLQGADIIYITDRPRDARRSTVRSILSNGLPFDGIEFIPHDQKAKFAKFRGVDYVIDDKIETVIDYCKHDIKTYLKVDNHNISRLGELEEVSLKTVSNFREFAEYIRSENVL